MSNYTKSTNFATKDNLTPGDPLKVVRGTEIDTEYNNIATAIATKTDNASAAITGGTITGITDLAVADGGTGASTAAGALNNLLPSQTSAANKYLQSDGTNASWDAVSLSTADITGTLPVANGGTGVTASTGTGNVVLSNSPTLVTPALGTPASGTATNLTGLPISTGVSGLGTGVATFLGTPSSANLISAVTDETGTGSLVFATSPTLVTPALGTPSALVGTNITGTASGLTAGNVTTNANLTGAVTSVGNATSLGSFSSANLLGALTDETGTGSAVFATSPTLVTPILGTPTSATLTNATGLPIATGVSGLGTGVATALAVNVGSSGAPLVNGGVLGTPSSGTVTNLTGTASININGTVGATTASTGAFTTLTTSSTVTHNGGTANGVTYLNGSKVLTSGSALVFDGTNLGLGVTPSAWFAGAKVFEFGSKGNTLTSGGAVQTLLTSNAYFDSSWKYGTTGAAAFYELNSGAHKWSTAASGTAGNAISFTQAMTLHASGNLGVGTTNNAYRIDAGATSDVTIAMNNSTSVTSGNRGNLTMYNSTGTNVGRITFGAVTDNVGTEIQFYTRPAAGSLTQAMTLEAGGNLGLGTTSVTTGISQRVLQITNGTNGCILFGSGATQNPIPRIFGSDAYDLNLATGVTTGKMVFYTNDTVRMRLPAAGGVQAVTTVSVGDATPSSSGAGITFPATQSASSDANTLDDYEEGTWTPTYSDWVTSPTSAEAIYIKIGKLVYVMVTVTGSNMQTTAAASQIIGLPFTPSGVSNASRGSGSVTNGNPNINGSILIYSNGSLYFATSFSSQSVMTITAMYQTTS